MIQDDIVKWTNDVNTLYTQVSEYIKNHPLPPLPSYQVISTRKGLYESYSNIVGISNDIATYLTLVVQHSMIRTSYKALVSKGGYGSSVTTLFNAHISEVSEKVSIIDNLLNVYKVAVENQLRFYQSVQYILGSPRLSSVS